MINGKSYLPNGKHNAVYSKSGCVQCKKSHKKCDETKPSCEKCQKRNISCSYIPQFILRRQTVSEIYKSLSKDIKANRSKSLSKTKEKGKCVELAQTKPTFFIHEGLTLLNHDMDPTIFFPKLYSMMIRQLKSDSIEVNSTQSMPFISNEIESQLSKSINQKDCTWPNFLQAIINADPIIEKCKNMAERKSHAIKVCYENAYLDSFILDIGKWIIQSSFLTLLSTKRTKSILSSVQYFYSKYPLVSHAMKVAVATFITDIYSEDGNLMVASDKWLTDIVIPNIKKLAIQIKKKSKKNKVIAFEEHTSLLFTFFLLFPENSRDSQSKWRTHLFVLNKLLSETHFQLSNSQWNIDENDNCFEMFMLIKSWLVATNISIQIQTDSSSIGDNDITSESTINFKNSSAKLFANRDLYSLTGISDGTLAILQRLSSQIQCLKAHNVYISGVHIVHFKLTNKDKTKTLLLRQFGTKLLKKLQINSNSPADPTLVDFNRDDTTYDNELHSLIKKTNFFVDLVLELYLKFFFIDSNSNQSGQCVELLKKILETWYSIPYVNKGSSFCYLTLYNAALISLLLEDDNLEDHFLGILKCLSLQGSTMATSSLKKLNYIKHILMIKDYQQLISHNYDFYG